MFGINYKNERDQQDQKSWEKAIKEVNQIIKGFENSHSTIFGRAKIVNTLIEPKLIYLAHTLNPPKHILQKYKTAIRKFIFKNTPSKVQHITLIQELKRGGINLHDMEQKITSIRLKSVKKFIEDPKKYPIMYYYVAALFRDYIKFDNNKSHYGKKLPKYYKNIKNIYRQHKNLINNTKPINYYKEIIKAKQTPLKLNEQLKIFVIKVLFTIISNRALQFPLFPIEHYNYHYFQ